MVRVLALVVVLCAAFYVGTCSPDYYPGDDRYYLNLAGQIVEQHTVALRITRTPDPDSSFRGHDGRFYAKYTLGHPLLLAVAYALVKPLEGHVPATLYALFQRLAFGLVPALAVAGALALCLWRARALGYTTATCATWTLGMGVATGLWPATKTLLSEPTQAFLVTLIYALSVRALERPTPTLALGLGLACAHAYHTKITLALGAGVAALALAARPERRVARLGAFALVVAAGVLAMLWYNTVRSGTPWVLGYETGQDTVLGFCTPWWSGLAGLCISAGKGVFFYSPFLVLALAGGRAFLRRHPRDAQVALGLTLPQLLLYSTWNGWHGDWVWGPRFLVTFLPVIGMFALPAVERALAARRGVLLGALVSAGVAVQLLGVLVQPYTYIDVIKDLPIAAGPDKLADTPPDRPFMMDGLLYNHWHPSFSPLIGHAWLLRRRVVGQADGDHPWAWLDNADLQPSGGEPKIDLWWDQAPALGALVALIALLAGALLARAWRGLPDVVPAPAPPAEPAPDLPVLAPRAAGRTTALALAALSLATLPAAFASAAAGVRAGLVANALAGALAALWIGRAAARLDARADPRRVACIAFCATLLWPRARELSPFVPVALLTAALLEAALARGRGYLAALAAVGVLSIAQAALRGTGPVPAGVGLYAFALSPGKSLWPFALVALAGLPRLAAGDAPARLLIGCALVAAGVEACAGGWMQDAGWGPAGLAPALVALLVAAGPALSRPRAGTRVLIALSVAITLSAVAVDPAELWRVQASVPGLMPPGHPRFDPAGRQRLAGAIFVPELSPVPGQLWLARLALTGAKPSERRAPWTGLFWRGYQPRSGRVPPWDLAWTAR